MFPLNCGHFETIDQLNALLTVDIQQFRFKHCSFFFYGWFLLCIIVYKLPPKYTFFLSQSSPGILATNRRYCAV